VRGRRRKGRQGVADRLIDVAVPPGESDRLEARGKAREAVERFGELGPFGALCYLNCLNDLGAEIRGRRGLRIPFNLSARSGGT